MPNSPIPCPVQPTSYCIKIARFMPRVEIVKKCGISARRLFILGHNGKVGKIAELLEYSRYLFLQGLSLFGDQRRLLDRLQTRGARTSAMQSNEYLLFQAKGIYSRPCSNFSRR